MTTSNSLRSAYFEIIESIGEDLSREGLKGTPERAAKALRFLTRGYDMTLEEIINGALFPCDSDEIVIVQNIELYSLCEHHLLPFFGKCHVAYVPNGQVLGLSKIARIVDMFAQRLQIQEQLTEEIASTLMETTAAKGVAVTIEAKHLCMMMRGVGKQNSVMKTSAMLGCFRENLATRSEYLALLSAGS